MKQFTALYLLMDSKIETADKVAALVRYLSSATAADAAWALYFLSGRKIARLVSSKTLKKLTNELAPLPAWLFDTCYDAVGDMAETLSLLHPGKLDSDDIPLHKLITMYLLPMRALKEAERCALITEAWACLDADERMVWNKLVMGTFRPRLSRTLLEQAVAKATGIPQTVVAQRMAGEWEPDPEWFTHLMSPNDANQRAHTYPYPFCIAQVIEISTESLGDRNDWFVEWKWEGVRAQLVRRAGETHLWSQFDELITCQFPEIAAIGEILPDDTILDGEVLAWDYQAQRPLPHGYLQSRSEKKNLTRQTLKQIPVLLMAYDILEVEGKDVRSLPHSQRRSILQETVAQTASNAICLPPVLDTENWAELAKYRELGNEKHSEGLMLRLSTSSYDHNSETGSWRIWKAAPHRVMAVLLSARVGSSGSVQFSDYSFGVWHEGAFIPVATIGSDLCQEMAQEIDQFIRKHTKERFGPARIVEPLLVCELVYEGIQVSSRHKAGLTLRSPRIARWLHDTPAAEAATLASLRLPLAM